MSIKKTIFLSNKNDCNFKGMAVVTFEKKNINTFGTIKTFNLDNKANYILGIKQNNKITDWKEQCFGTALFAWNYVNEEALFIDRNLSK